MSFEMALTLGSPYLERLHGLFKQKAGSPSGVTLPS